MSENDSLSQESGNSKATKAAQNQLGLSVSCCVNSKNEIHKPQRIGFREKFIIDSYVGSWDLRGKIESKDIKIEKMDI